LCVAFYVNGNFCKYDGVLLVQIPADQVK